MSLVLQPLITVAREVAKLWLRLNLIQSLFEESCFDVQVVWPS